MQNIFLGDPQALPPSQKLKDFQFGNSAKAQYKWSIEASTMTKD